MTRFSGTDLWRIKVVLIEESHLGLFWGQWLVVRILTEQALVWHLLLSLDPVRIVAGPALFLFCRHSRLRTMDKMTTQGRFSLLTMACDRVDLPDPELPATPIMLKSAHGGL